VTDKVFRSVFGTPTESGLWQLTRRLRTVRACICMARARSVKAPGGQRITALEIEWLPRVSRSGDGADGVRHFTSESVFIHEPKTRLYDSLPLARFDAAAQRFWKRVFA